MVKLLNFITFQIWAGISALGLLMALISGNSAPVGIATWVGLILGVAANELTASTNDTGIEIV